MFILIIFGYVLKLLLSDLLESFGFVDPGLLDGLEFVEVLLVLELRGFALLLKLKSDPGVGLLVLLDFAHGLVGLGLSI